MREHAASDRVIPPTSFTGKFKLRTRAPAVENDREISAIEHAIRVGVGTRIGLRSGRSPVSENYCEVDSVGVAVTIDVGVAKHDTCGVAVDGVAEGW